MADIHIIGAGPSGSIAAISAARKGYNVLVSEEHEKAGGKPCSGLFSASGLKTLEEYFDWKKAVNTEIYGAEIHLGRSIIKVRKRSPVAYACDRNKFDRLLADAAGSEGARIEYGNRIRGDFKASKVIGADGANSYVARHFRFPRLQRFIGTMHGEVIGEWNEKMVQVFVSSDFPGFFGWVIPRGGNRFEIGCGVELPENPMAAFERLKRKINANKVSDVRGSIIPVKAREKTAMVKNSYGVMLVGDAAGQTKATTGGGVLFGAWCAEIAGKTADPISYEMGWRMKYGNELLLHRVVRKFLNTLDDEKLTSLGQKLSEKNFDAFLEEHGEMDVLSKTAIQLILRPYLLH